MERDNTLKHAVIADGPEDRRYGKAVEAELSAGRKVWMADAGYTEEELEQFRSEEENWILRCKGSHFFLADSDSGEDAEAYYCGYFDPVPERAVFREGKLAGFYICTDGIRYSGRGRYNFDIDDWGFPGQDPVEFARAGSGTHIFLFSDEETRDWKDWSLLERDPDAIYENYLDF